MYNIGAAALSAAAAILISSAASATTSVGASSPFYENSVDFHDSFGASFGKHKLTTAFGSATTRLTKGPAAAIRTTATSFAGTSYSGFASGNLTYDYVYVAKDQAAADALLSAASQLLQSPSLGCSGSCGGLNTGIMTTITGLVQLRDTNALDPGGVDPGIASASIGQNLAYRYVDSSTGYSSSYDFFCGVGDTSGCGTAHFTALGLIESNVGLNFYGSVAMQASANAAANSGPQSQAFALIDPVIILNPELKLNPADYTLFLSPGIGNSAAGVPEPGAWVLMLLGAGAIGSAARRRRGSRGATASA